MDTPTRNHLGQKIRRIRELRDIKQETLADALGTTQKAISLMESKEMIEDGKLIEVANALGVSVEAIKNFSEDAVINYFNNFYDTVTNSNFNNHACTFNPLDKVVELYERLVQAEKDKVEYLEKLFKDK